MKKTEKGDWLYKILKIVVILIMSSPFIFGGFILCCDSIQFFWFIVLVVCVICLWSWEWWKDEKFKRESGFYNRSGGNNGE